MSQGWMVRSGRGGAYVEEFLKHNVIAIGWNDLEVDLSNLSQEEIVVRVQKTYPNYHRSAVANAAAMLFKMASTLANGDRVVTYDSERRVYHLGRIIGPYKHQPNLITGLQHTRAIAWDREISRDALSRATKNSLGATLSLFSLSDAVIKDLEHDIEQAPILAPVGPDSDDSEESIDDTAERSLELIKDLVLGLDEDEMEQLLASLLRAMGYKARVSPKGPDRGLDVFASPDGLGLQSPRIKAEVKHRPKNTMGAQDIRNFIATLRQGDCGIYLSTGGFTKEARYEAERANYPVSLINLDDLVLLITENYVRFDEGGRLLVPLVPIWWPAKRDDE
jgi:restriction system protein